MAVVERILGSYFLWALRNPLCVVSPSSGWCQRCTVSFKYPAYLTRRPSPSAAPTTFHLSSPLELRVWTEVFLSVLLLHTLGRFQCPGPDFIDYKFAMSTCPTVLWPEFHFRDYLHLTALKFIARNDVTVISSPVNQFFDRVENLTCSSRLH